MLCEVLEQQLRLRERYAPPRAGSITATSFFHADGTSIADPECTRWRWNRMLSRTAVQTEIEMPGDSAAQSDPISPLYRGWWEVNFIVTETRMKGGSRA